MRTAKTTRHHRDCGHHHAEPPRGASMYYGWSHEEGRMQMMDLPSYLESFRLGYERAIEDLQGQLTNMAQTMFPGGTAPAGWPPAGGQAGWQPTAAAGQQHRHHHDHHHDHDCGCGCGCRQDDCRCTCCIVDADYVVYARCFERRVIPIEIENDTRRAREDVTVAVSDVRSAGGRELPWKVAVEPRSLTLEACSHTEIELVVDIECGETKDQSRTARKATARAEGQEEAAQRRERPDVDECEVGYVTVRLEGCLVRPIVVAIAVLPRDCDAFHTSCSCSCCC